MRFGLVLVVTTAILSSGATARAQNITPEGGARAASAQAAILQFCGTYFALNGPKAVALGTAAQDFARQTFPKGKAKAAIDKEFKRRFREVKVTGERMWCQYQREVQRSLNTGVFLD